VAGRLLMRLFLLASTLTLRLVLSRLLVLRFVSVWRGGLLLSISVLSSVRLGIGFGLLTKLRFLLYLLFCFVVGSLRCLVDKLGFFLKGGLYGPKNSKGLLQPYNEAKRLSKMEESRVMVIPWRTRDRSKRAYALE